jgi:hypothetical protein
MQRKNTLQVKLSDTELEKLRKYCASRDIAMSEFMRDYVKGLPEVN